MLFVTTTQRKRKSKRNERKRITAAQAAIGTTWVATAVSFVVAAFVWPFFLPVVALVALVGAVVGGPALVSATRRVPETKEQPVAVDRPAPTPTPTPRRERRAAKVGKGATYQRRQGAHADSGGNGRQGAHADSGGNGSYSKESLAALHGSLDEARRNLADLSSDDLLEFLVECSDLDGWSPGREAMAALHDLAMAATAAQESLRMAGELISRAFDAIDEVRKPASEMPGDAEGEIERFTGE